MKRRTKKIRILAAGLCMILALSGGFIQNLYAAEPDAGFSSSAADIVTEETQAAETEITDNTDAFPSEGETAESEGNVSEEENEVQESTVQESTEIPELPEKGTEPSEAESEETVQEEEAQIETEDIAEVQENPVSISPESENSLTEDTAETDIWASDEEILLEEEEAVSVAASADGLPSVSYVSNTQSMNTDFALAYAFRSGLTSIDKSRTSGFSWPGESFHTKIISSFERDGNSGWGDNRIILKINKWDESYRNQNYVTYTNVADYMGQKLDLKVTVVSWAGFNDKIKDSAGNSVAPWLGFNTDRINISYLGIARVRLRFELLYSGTSTVANVGAHTTMRDIDAGQSLWFSEASHVDSLYLLNGNNYITKKNASTPAPAHLELTGGKRSEQRQPDDVNTWVQINFTGYFEVYFCEHDEWNKLKSTSQFIHFDATPKTIGLYEIPGTEKRVGSQSQGYTDMQAHNSSETAYSTAAGSKVRYEIAQTVYPGTYSSFIVKDVLDSCLSYESASVSTAGSGDATNWFDISYDAGSNTVTFTAKNMNQEYMFNNVTFYFRINVTVKDAKTIAAHGHNNGTAQWYIGNEAQRTIGTDIKNTNMTYISGLTTGSYYVKKTDAKDGSVIAERAVFELQEWNRESGQYVRLRDLTRDSTTLLYATGNLSRSGTNEGKFRIVETSPPKGYKAGWTKDIILENDTTGTVFTAADEKDILPAGDITVTKKIRESDIIWAHGNPVFRFTVYGTDQKGRKHTFEDYVEFSENQYEKDGEYAVLRCVFRNIPVGEYMVSEKKTLRYRLESIRADTSNVQISGESGKATLSKEKLSAAVTFQNVKTRYNRLSHTDVVTNTIPVRQ